MIKACTIVARNYVAHARVLANSFFAHHPDGQFAVLLIDDEARTFDPAAENFECLRFADIGLDRAEIRRLAAIYDVTELATAVKPPFLRHLLREAAATSSIWIPTSGSTNRSRSVAPRHRARHRADAAHDAPMPRDGRRIDDFHILAAGVYNLGFIAVGAGRGAVHRLVVGAERGARRASIRRA